jgi:hypothetical protein
MPRYAPASILFFACILALPVMVHAQQAGPSEFRSHSAALDVNDNDDYSTFSLLDREVPRYRLFFTGEFHEQPGNTIVQWKMFRYLHQRSGLRMLVFELPVGMTYLLNHYLRENDSLGYFEVTESAMDIADRIFFARLYAFNRTLPAGQKLILAGIDYEKAYDQSREALKLMLKAHPGITDAEITSIHKMSSFTRDSTLKQWARHALGRVRSDSSFYQSQLGEDYITFCEVLRGIDCDAFVAAETSRTALDARELFLADNFEQLLARYPREKMYGQFGETHTCLRTNADWCYERNWSSFIAHANSDPRSPVRDSVLILCYVYRNNDYPGNYFPSLPHADYLELLEANGQAHFILAGPASALPSAGPLSQKCQYLIFDNYTRQDEKDHYSDPQNDKLGAVSNTGYYIDAIYASFSQWKHSTVELGYFLGYQFFYNDQSGGAALTLEYMVDQRIYGVKTFFGMRVDPVSGGINLAYHTDLTHASVGVIPQLGLSYRCFHLNYGYDWEFAGPLRNIPDKHTVSLKCILPFRKQ